MDSKDGVRITTRDKVMRAWQNSMELVRDFQGYANEIQDDDPVKATFAEFAEDEARHAAKFLQILHAYEKAYK